MKTQSLRANISKEEKQELEQVAVALDVPESQIIREGVRKEMKRLKRTHPKLKQAAEAV